MKGNKLHRVAIAVLIAATAACEDLAGPPADGAPADLPASPAPPALIGVEARRVASAVEDALTRLIPAADAGHSALDASLRELAAMLRTGDAITLNRQIEQTLRALDEQPMTGADADALRLALALVADAAGAGVASEPD